MAGRIADTPTTNFGLLAAPKPAAVDFSKYSTAPAPVTGTQADMYGTAANQDYAKAVATSNPTIFGTPSTPQTTTPNLATKITGTAGRILEGVAGPQIERANAVAESVATRSMEPLKQSFASQLGQLPSMEDYTKGTDKAKAFLLGSIAPGGEGAVGGEAERIAGGLSKSGQEFTGALDKESPMTLPSLKSSIKSTSLEVAGRVEPSGLTTSMTNSGGERSTQNVLPSNDINALRDFTSIDKSQLTPEILTNYYQAVKQDEPTFVRITKQAAEDSGGQYAYRLKTPESVAAKLDRRTGRTLGSLGDTLGSTVVTDNVDQGMAHLKAAVEAQGGTVVFDDFRDKPNFLGYKSVHGDVTLPSGVRGEVQVMTRETLYQKEEAHKIYDTWRKYIESNGDATLANLAEKIPKDQLYDFYDDVERSNEIFAGKESIPQDVIDAVDKRIVNPKQGELPFGASGGGKPPATPPAASAAPGGPEGINPRINTKNLNISDDSKELLESMAEDLNPTTQKKLGPVMTNEEVQAFAEANPHLVNDEMLRETTLRMAAATLNARKNLASLLEQGGLGKNKEIMEAFYAVKSSGADQGRLLQARKIGADPVEKATITKMTEDLLKMGEDIDEIIKRGENVNFDDFNQASEFYRSFVKPKMTEWLDLIRYNSMLSSPKTHIVNIASNAVNAALVAPMEKALTGGLDFLGSAVTGAPRSAYAGESGAYLKKFVTNTGEAAHRFAEVMRGKRDITNLDTKNIPLANRGLKGAAAKALSFPMQLLEGMDQFFMAMTEAGETGALEYRSSKGVPVGDMEQTAQKKALYRLFRQELFDEDQGHMLDAVDQVTGLIEKARNNKNPIVSTVAKFTVPFLRTPMNIFKQGLEYSPAGLGTIPGAKNKTEQLSKAIIGSSIFAGAATLLTSGRLTWGEPTDPALKQTFRAGGLQAYSVKIGDKWVSYQKLPPGLAFPLAMTAAIHDTQQNKKIDDNTVDLVLSGIAKYGQFLGDQSYAKSIGDILAAAKGGEAGIAKVASNYAQQLIPLRALGGWLARLSDPTQRKIDSQASFVDQQVQLLMLNIPGLSQKVPARTDVAGKPIPQQFPVLGAFSPVNVTQETPQAQEYQKMLDIREVNKQTTYEGEQTRGHAATEYDKIKMMRTPEEKKQALLRIAGSDPALAKSIIKLATDAQQNVGASDQKLLNSTTATRARYIADEIKKLKTPEEKKVLLKDYATKKILTADTFSQLVELLKQPGSSPSTSL